jgi:hypothetical protein
VRLAAPDALLWLLLAIPLVLLYFVRPRARTARVGSLLLYREVRARQTARAPLARLEKLLSLVLHLAALAGIVLALARPTLGPVGPRRIVAVLDASASMGSRFDGSTRFEKARARAVELARELRAEDELGFVLAGATPHLLLAPSPRAARPELALEQASLEGGATNLTDALALASALGPTEVWLLSDGAGPSTRQGPSSLGTLSRSGRSEREVPLYYARFGEPTDRNAGVVALAARALPGAESDVEVQATVWNASQVPATIRPTYTLDRLPLVALEPVEVAPLSRARLAPRRLELPQGGLLGLHIDCAGDVLAADDDAFVLVPPPRRTRVATPASVFLRAALEADDQVSLVAPGSDADLAFGDTGARSEKLVVGPDEVARAASRLELQDLGATVPTRVSRVEREHPLLRHVALEEAVFTRARSVLAPPPWRVVVAAGDVPLVLAREDGHERAVVFTFAPEDSDLVLRRAWPLLVSNAVSWIRGEALRESEDPVRAGDVARIACEKEATAVRTGGEPVRFVAGKGFVTTTATARPGLYEVFSGEERVARFAVSLLDQEESTVAARERLGIGERPAPPPLHDPLPLEPGALLPLGALALLLLETWAHHRRNMG